MKYSIFRYTSIQRGRPTKDREIAPLELPELRNEVIVDKFINTFRDESQRVGQTSINRYF